MPSLQAPLDAHLHGQARHAESMKELILHKIMKSCEERGNDRATPMALWETCAKCREYYDDNPALIHALASVGIERGKSTYRMALDYSESYHRRGAHDMMDTVSTDQRGRSPEGVSNVKARDRARRRALSRMLSLYPSEKYALVPKGQRGSWAGTHRAARIIRDRHPRVFARVLAEERAKESFVPLRRGRPSQ